MGRFDEATYGYFSRPEYFADLINAGCFGGKRVVDPGELEEMPARTQERTDEGDARSLYRDVRMKLHRGTSFVLLAVENQSEVDWEMPLRILRYNAADYQRQLEEIHEDKRRRREEKGLRRNRLKEKLGKGDRLRPIYVVCFYHGTGEWTGPSSLSDLMDFGEDAADWKGCFADYPITVINAEDRELAENCRTQLRQLLEVMGARRDKKRLYGLLASDEYGNLDQATARIIAVMANVPEFLEREEEYKNAEGGYNMCQAMDELRADFKEEGRAEGRAEGRDQALMTAVRNLMTSMKLSMEQAMNALMIPEESRGKIRLLMHERQ
ncbi:MAG: Rpn family recombination-promoting nuclease/putative transposase [Lachnospiraceae bacterium]|nr:Rpn family recombination-promoting nuclease/putative transposase [Lachnospiraceae bacterium]